MGITRDEICSTRHGTYNHHFSGGVAEQLAVFLPQYFEKWELPQMKYIYSDGMRPIITISPGGLVQETQKWQCFGVYILYIYFRIQDITPKLFSVNRTTIYFHFGIKGKFN